MQEQEVELPCSHGTAGPAVTTILSYVQVPVYDDGDEVGAVVGVVVGGLEVGSAVVGVAVEGAMVPVQGPTVDHASLYASPCAVERGSYAPMGQKRL